MTIGFDFDKVFINYPPFLPDGLVDFLYKGSIVFKQKEKLSSPLHYRFPRIVEQKLRALSHFPIFRSPIMENIDALNKISRKKSGQTYLVSSRFSFLHHRTDIILNKYKLKQYFDGIYFNYDNKQPHIFKEATIKKLKIDTYVDDDLDLAIYLSKKIPTLTIYWVTDSRKSVITLPKNVIPIQNLKQLYRILFKNE